MIKSDMIQTRFVFALMRTEHLLSQHCPHAIPAWMQQQELLEHPNVQISVCKVSAGD